MNKMQQQVKDFHEKFGHPAPEKPWLIHAGRFDKRLDWIDEELAELVEAVADGDIVEIADALGDILYLTLGTAVEYGIDLEPIFDEIHRSNMSKTPAPDGGKVLKGKDYFKPNLTPIVEAQR